MFENRYELKIKVINPNVLDYYTKITNNYKNKYKTHPDSGFDLISPEKGSDCFDFAKSNTGLIDLGIQCSMTKIITLENGNILKTPSPYYLFPRSSIYKTRYRMANSVGIIDCGYRGNLMAAMDCHRDDIGLPEKKEILVGHRYWQICTPLLEPLYNIQLVTNLDDTTRGSGGHGSTGL